MEVTCHASGVPLFHTKCVQLFLIKSMLILLLGFKDTNLLIVIGTVTLSLVFIL